MNTTITKDQMILKDNEVYVMSHETPQNNEYGYMIAPGLSRKITHSTAKLEGVIHLNREWFVRGEDIEELADKAGWEYSTFDQAASAFSTGFKAGYNAKKGEFTREEMVAAFVAGRETLSFNGFQPSVSEMFEKFIGSLRPLSIPNSLTLNKDNEIVKIEW